MYKKYIINEFIFYTKVILVSLMLVYVLNNTLVVNAQVTSSSMESTVMTGSRIIINRLAYRSQSPQRGDIISFYCPDKEKSEPPFLKRIIALPGESVQGTNGKIFINGEEFEENYIKEISYMDFGPFIVPENSYFVMGDNRNDSWDSRYWENKFVNIKVIIGRAEVEYYPELKSLNK